MPTMRRRRLQERRPPLEGAVRIHLLTGARPGPEDFESWVEVRLLNGAQVWSEHRLDLLDEWIAEHPGTRPDGWWRYEAQESRRVIADVSGIVVPGDWEHV